MWSGKVESRKDLRRLAKDAISFAANDSFFHVVNRIPYRFRNCKEYEYLLLLAQFLSVISAEGRNTLPCHFALCKFRTSKRCKKYMRSVLLHCSNICLRLLPESEVAKRELASIRRKLRTARGSPLKHLSERFQLHLLIAS